MGAQCDADFGLWRLRLRRLRASGGNVEVGRMDSIMPGRASLIRVCRPARSNPLLISSIHASHCSRVRNIGGAKRRDRFAQSNPIDLSNRA
jgi:hypothetical protein